MNRFTSSVRDTLSRDPSSRLADDMTSPADSEAPNPVAVVGSSEVRAKMNRFLGRPLRQGLQAGVS